MSRISFYLLTIYLTTSYISLTNFFYRFPTKATYLLTVNTGQVQQCSPLSDSLMILMQRTLWLHSWHSPKDAMTPQHITPTSDQWTTEYLSEKSFRKPRMISMTLRVAMAILNPLMLSLLHGMALCQTFVILYLHVHAAQLR